MIRYASGHRDCEVVDAWMAARDGICPDASDAPPGWPSWPTWAGEFAFESIRIRGGVSGGSPLGRERQSDCTQIDLAATVRLPWEKELGGGWLLGTRMLVSIGALRGANESNGIMTMVPLDIVVGRKDGLIAIDMGGGPAE